MTPVKTYSRTIYLALRIAGGALFIGLLLIAWTSDTSEVAIGSVEFKLQLTAAAFVLGGGTVLYARKYRGDAERETALAEVVRRNLGRS